jgi:hypothetical protein
MPLVPAYAGEAETDCCHLVGVLDTNNRITAWVTVGSCVPCPLTGICKKATVGTIVEAYCE